MSVRIMMNDIRYYSNDETKTKFSHGHAPVCKTDYLRETHSQNKCVEIVLLRSSKDKQLHPDWKRNLRACDTPLDGRCFVR